MEALLDGKLVLVTGASSGIGRSCAIACSRQGARLALAGRNPQRLEETLSQLEGNDHAMYNADLRQPEEVLALASDVIARQGKVSGFIHSAGVEMTVPVSAMKAEGYRQLYDINVVAAFELVRQLSLRKNVPEGGASYVFISSIKALIGEPAQAAYSASKGALIAGMRSLAMELAPRSIRVNAISPGFVETPMVHDLFMSMDEAGKAEIIGRHPLGLGKPEDVAQAALFLLSGMARWITGTNLVADGGYTAR